MTISAQADDSRKPGLSGPSCNARRGKECSHGCPQHLLLLRYGLLKPCFQLFVFSFEGFSIFFTKKTQKHWLQDVGVASVFVMNNTGKLQFLDNSPVHGECRKLQFPAGHHEICVNSRFWFTEVFSPSGITECQKKSPHENHFFTLSWLWYRTSRNKLVFTGCFSLCKGINSEKKEKFSCLAVHECSTKVKRAISVWSQK